MNQPNQTEKENLNKNNSNSEESSDDESLDFFHLGHNAKKEEENNQLLNKKRKDSNKLNNEEKEDRDSISKDSSGAVQNEEKKKKKKKKKEKNNNFKSVKSKQICQFYINGACKKGDKCPYSHDAEQIHKKELCKFYLSGKCAKGEKCLYSHDLSEIPCRFYHGLGFCENFQNCPFSHERLDQEGIKEFIISNEDFLKETKNKYGRTNLDEFYNAYIKEKEGDDQYIMMPEFIKNEDKEREKEINEMKDKIPLGFVVMSNNNKVLNELKSFYNSQQMNVNNIFNNIKNFNRNDSINSIDNNINEVTKLINDIKNSKNNQNKIINKTISQKEINNNLKINDLDNKEKALINRNNTNIISNKANKGKLDLNQRFNFFNEKKDNIEKNRIEEENNKKDKSNNETNIEEKDKPKEEKKIINPIEINPFLNPMLISSKAINNLF